MKIQMPVTQDQILYPDSDGQPMAENTLQLDWIVRLYTNLDALYRDNPEVVVFADLLWYAVEGQPSASRAPDVMVVFGRPKGYRGSYMQWKEDGIAPQVVFEILSPGNTGAEMDRKFAFYDAHGAEEYYIYDPYAIRMQGWRRQHGRLQPILQMDGWVSPRLGVRFDLSGEELVVFDPNNRRFLTNREQVEQHIESEQRADQEKQRADREKQRADAERVQREQEAQRAERLAARLRALGIDPEE